MAGALYATGYAPEEILEFFRVNASNIFQWRHFSRHKPGFLDSERYCELFEPWLKGHTLSIPPG